MTKLCEDCIFSFKGPYSWKCHAPQNMEVLTRLTKEPIPQWRFESCETQRRANWFDALVSGFCGKQGRWFKPKEYTGEV
jgi:hypothetical protein